MICRRSLAIVFCCILACMVLLPAARANDWNQMTKVQFDEPIEIPNVVLPAGAYWFVLLNDQGDRQVVQILNSDRSLIYATVQTVATERARPTNHTEIKFVERPASQPKAVLDWYYPGLVTGHEFLYPPNEEKALTRGAKQDVVARPMNAASNTSTPGA
ncbi:MAG TPA: hypothetical protein VJP02_08220 [Candidatus Sulfotelmatobacter sp.]|nr:hypothetical protein [Candidatus Sulfotelmatobacter sp.]